MPWWQEVGPVVEGARATHGVGITVLRLLEAEADRPGAGGPVTYLAELDHPAAPLPALAPWSGPDPNGEEPLRQTWARPGGPGADLAWADAALTSRGTPRTGSPVQVRTWNLSSLWRLPVGDGAAWLKVVPPFFAHEGPALALLGEAPVPPLIAHDGPRVLLDEIAGEDQYTASGPPLQEMVRLLVDLQAAWIGRIDEVLATGAPDWRALPLTAALTGLVERWAPHVEGVVAASLDALVAGLPERFAELAGCGLPDTLVHGDFHRGNVRARAEGGFVLLDWGDCGVGHPMLDQPAFLTWLADDDVEPVRRAWTAAWRAHVPDADPDRAAALLAPVAALRQALIYQVFLDNIEPSERIYHAADPARWLERAATLTD